MESWKGEIAVVTGACSGIGKAIAVALVKRGVRVAGMSLHLGKMTELKVKMEGEGFAGSFLPIQCDVTKLSDVKRSFEVIFKSLGTPSVLINNAGVIKSSVLERIDVQDARVIFETNVLAAIAVTKEALRQFNPDGVIFNINSLSAHTSEAIVGLGAYSSSKRALSGLTETLKSELSLGGSRIRVTTQSISPGLTKSGMTQPHESTILRDVPMLEADDVAEVVIFVLSQPNRVNISEIIIEARGFSKLKLLSQLAANDLEKPTDPL